MTDPTTCPECDRPLVGIAKHPAYDDLCRTCIAWCYLCGQRVGPRATCDRCDRWLCAYCAEDTYHCPQVECTDCGELTCTEAYDYPQPPAYCTSCAHKPAHPKR